MATTLTTPAPPSTATIASRLLAIMAAQTGVLSDTNVGSVVRTWAEAIGSVNSINAVELQAMAYQAIIYGGFSAFDVVPLNAASSTGTVTFATTSSGGSGSPAPVSVFIPTGTVVQTTGGIQFSTLSDTTLVSGSTSVSVSAQAINPGLAGNVGASSITLISSPLTAVLYVNNAASFNGGTNAETIQQTAARFANVVAALQLSSPQAVAAACLGVTNGTEVVQYATCYEPYLSSGPPYSAYFNAIIDNGAGSASATLITNVTNKLNGDLVNFTTSGFRPAGVPFSVSAVTPTAANVAVSATHAATADETQVSAQITAAVQNYFASLNFGATIQQSVLATQVSNAVINQVTALTVQLLLVSTPVSSIAVAATSRAQLGTLAVTVT